MASNVEGLSTEEIGALIHYQRDKAIKIMNKVGRHADQCDDCGEYSKDYVVLCKVCNAKREADLLKQGGLLV